MYNILLIKEKKIVQTFVLLKLVFLLKNQGCRVAAKLAILENLQF